MTDRKQHGEQCVEEQRIEVAGLGIAVRRWRAGAPRRVLALHGWLDNAASFDRLAAHWPDTDVLAVDLPGHGLSDHKPLQASYNLWDDLLDLLRLCDQLGWQRFHLLGHSRGAMMALLLAAAMPQRVDSAVLLDGLVPEPVAADAAALQLGRFLQDHLNSGKRPRRGYASLEEAMAARCRAAGLSPRIAERLLIRNLERRGDRYHWRTDPRLTAASAFKLSAEHSRGLVTALRVPGLLLLAERGLAAAPMAPAIRSLAGLNPGLLVEQMPGSHHFHLEAAADTMAARIHDFWDRLAVAESSTAEPAKE